LNNYNEHYDCNDSTLENNIERPRKIGQIHLAKLISVMFETIWLAFKRINVIKLMT